MATLWCVAGQSSAFAENATKNEGLKPYIQVQPVAGDERVVRVFFSPACSYSKQYLSFFNNLSKTLPASKKFAYTPLVNKGDGLTYALAFAAVKRFYPAYLSLFVEASMIGVQDKGIATTNWVGIERIGKAIKLPASIAVVVAQNKDVLVQDVVQFMEVRKALKVTNTPSVAVAGTYIVTPEFTAGDVEQFNQLVNAVISLSL